MACTGSSQQVPAGPNGSTCIGGPAIVANSDNAAAALTLSRAGTTVPTTGGGAQANGRAGKHALFGDDDAAAVTLSRGAGGDSPVSDTNIKTGTSSPHHDALVGDDDDVPVTLSRAAPKKGGTGSPPRGSAKGASALVDDDDAAAVTLSRGGQMKPVRHHNKHP